MTRSPKGNRMASAGTRSPVGSDEEVSELTTIYAKKPIALFICIASPAHLESNYRTDCRSGCHRGRRGFPLAY